ncbi:MAG: DUF2058 family protein [Deltaproteobacteria bacterium]|nr:MAG: DUF2058 family protein [Deltaproteobacteria bacterium]
MGSLRDELLKAKIVSRKEARKAAHEARVRRKELGREGIEAERKAAEERRKTEEAKRKAAERKRVRREQAARAEHERQNRLKTIIRNGMLPDIPSGPRRFYFVAMDGKIPFLQIAESVATRLERGELAIVEAPEFSPDGFVLVTREAAGKIAEIDPERVRFSNAA